MPLRSCLLLLILCIPLLTAQAQPEQAPEPPAPDQNYEQLPFMTERNRERETIGAEAPSVAGLLVRTLGALLLIVGLIGAAAWGLRKFGGARFAQTTTGALALEVLSTVSLGERRSLSVVRFGDATLLIGSSPQNITLLATHQGSNTEIENKTPTRVSVADLLEREETNADFAQELARASAGSSLQEK
jgi:flagellar biosynthetic protein FliO